MSSEPTSHSPVIPWTAQQCALLDALLDEILPPVGDLPAGSTLGLLTFLAARAVDTNGFAAIMDLGLHAAAKMLTERGASDLRALPEPERLAFVQALEAGEPRFFSSFARQSYMGYYTHPTIPPRFGLPDRPPQPLGHTVQANMDLDVLLAPVRLRGKLYRDA
jgi:hypothetical protein